MRTMLFSLFHVVRLTGRKVTKFIPNFPARALHFFHTHRVLTNRTPYAPGLSPRLTPQLPARSPRRRQRATQRARKFRPEDLTPRPLARISNILHLQNRRATPFKQAGQTSSRPAKLASPQQSRSHRRTEQNAKLPLRLPFLTPSCIKPIKPSRIKPIKPSCIKPINQQSAQ